MTTHVRTPALTPRSPRPAMPHAAAATATSRAGWSMVGIAVLHVVFWSVVTWTDWGAWAAGDLWGADPTTLVGYRLHYGYWALVGSFAVPLFLLGLLIVHLAELGVPVPGYLGWVVLVWVLVASLLLEPNGFPLGFIPAALLLRARHIERRTHPPLAT